MRANPCRFILLAAVPFAPALLHLLYFWLKIDICSTSTDTSHFHGQRRGIVQSVLLCVVTEGWETFGPCGGMWRGNGVTAVSSTWYILYEVLIFGGGVG